MLVCLDLEGVLVPEIWIAFAKKVKRPELLRTTRDEPNYNVLMQYRIDILNKANLKADSIQDVIAKLEPLPGAKVFLNELRKKFEVVLLSDTFYEFAGPLMKKLGYPTLFCNNLIVNSKGKVTGFKLRQKDGKAKAVKAMRGLGFEVRAAGDSYNDATMLEAANRGVWFNPPRTVAREFSQFKVTRSYASLLKALSAK